MALVSGAQLRAARALLKLEMEELAALAGVSSATLRRIEASDGEPTARPATLRVIEAELVKRGVELLDDRAPGARLHPGTVA